MISDKSFLSLQEKVRNSRLEEKFDKCKPVAIIAGPCLVVEFIVKNASIDSGIPMDWHYCGGRGIVYALGDRAKARHALWLSCPQSDLTTSDCYISNE